jgi:LCP family protein required for cell wall assembly
LAIIVWYKGKYRVLDIMGNFSNQTSGSPDWIKRGLWAAFLISAIITAVLVLRNPNNPGDQFQPDQENGLAPESTIIIDLAELGGDSLLQTNSDRPGYKALDFDQTTYFLLTGLDTREWEEDTGPGLTDVILVGFLNTQNLNAGLISIPRDTWVDVPNYGPYKINQAFSLGEAYGYPGGGPGILMDTAGNLLDIEIDYYIQVDFEAFVVLVDSVDGVIVDVPEKILVWKNAEMNSGMKVLEPGLHKITGDIALGYVRMRDTPEGDFGRTKRQQQVLVALQKRLFSRDILTSLIPRLPGLYRDIASNVETNLSLNQLISLAWKVKDIDPRSISTLTINQPLVEAGINERGQYVLFPEIEQIRTIWGDMQELSATPVPEPTRELNLSEYVQMENAQVTVLNATVSSGLASETAEFLKAGGVNVTEVGNSDKFKDQTYVYDYSGNPYTIQLILELMGYTQNKLFYRADPSTSVDVVIILGADWAQENTIPTVE